MGLSKEEISCQIFTTRQQWASSRVWHRNSHFGRITFKIMHKRDHRRCYWCALTMVTYVTAQGEKWIQINQWGLSFFLFFTL